MIGFKVFAYQRHVYTSGCKYNPFVIIFEQNDLYIKNMKRKKFIGVDNLTGSCRIKIVSTYFLRNIYLQLKFCRKTQSTMSRGATQSTMMKTNLKYSAVKERKINN